LSTSGHSIHKVQGWNAAKSTLIRFAYFQRRRQRLDGPLHFLKMIVIATSDALPRLHYANLPNQPN
jgi:hypothetical protein